MKLHFAFWLRLTFWIDFGCVLWSQLSCPSQTNPSQNLIQNVNLTPKEKNRNRSGLIPRALGPIKTSLNCLKWWFRNSLFLKPNELSRNFEAPETEILVSGQETSALLNARRVDTLIGFLVLIQEHKVMRKKKNSTESIGCSKFESGAWKLRIPLRWSDLLPFFTWRHSSRNALQ